MSPFLTFYTPTYKRPKALAKCLASVAAQTVVEDIEQLVIPDHIGIGVGGMFARVPQYAGAVHGQYVHMLCDDDVLADTDAVEIVREFAAASGNPPLIVVRALKGSWDLPFGECWPPELARIDLSCLITRADVWTAHAAAYGNVYEGDYLFAKSLHEAGIQAAYLPYRFVVGGISHGFPETEVSPVAAWGARA